ncbi:hypothetical protein [Aquimarina sp. LLG6339-5]|uniref:hypothetical protein n=1 Tax=Aquimarina sp. LLG6339-5 TaxID=3160830 RepID=UPI00386D3E8B
MKEKLIVISLVISIINISCSNDDKPVEEPSKEITIEYIEKFDGSGWEIDLKKSTVFLPVPGCTPGPELNADYMIDDTSVIFNENSMKLIADYATCHQIYPSIDQSEDATVIASASKKIQEINIENLNVKQVTIEFNSEPSVDHYFYDFKIGNYIFNHTIEPENLNPYFENEKVTWKVIIDFKTNNHLLIVSSNRYTTPNLFLDLPDYIKQNSEIYHSIPIITFKTKSATATSEPDLMYMPNNTIIDSLKISINYTEN